MPTGRSDHQNRAARAPTMALAAFLLAIGLLGWRSVVTLTGSPAIAASGSVAETRATALIEPMTGPGKARVSIARIDGATRIIVLLDGPHLAAGDANPITGQIVSTLTDAAFGNTVSVRQFPFARGPASRPDTGTLIELGGLALLAGLCGWLTFAPRRDAPASAQPHLAAPQTPRPHRTAPSERQPRTSVPVRMAEQAALSDPAQAARVIRGWIHDKGGAA